MDWSYWALKLLIFCDLTSDLNVVSSSSMKSWRCRTLLFACLILIRLHLSEAACADYFKLSQWTSEHNSPITMETLTETFQLVDAENLKNIMICTLQNELLTNKRNVRHLLRHCLEVKDEKDIQVKCGNITHHKVYFYDFMCLVAKASGLPAEVCVKESVTKWLDSKLTGTTAPVQSNPTSTAPTNTVYAVLVISLLLNVVFLLWVLFFRERSKSKPNHSPQMNGSPEIMNLVQRQPEMHDETHSNEDATTALRVNNDVQANCKDENQV